MKHLLCVSASNTHSIAFVLIEKVVHWPTGTCSVLGQLAAVEKLQAEHRSLLIKKSTRYNFQYTEISMCVVGVANARAKHENMTE